MVRNLTCILILFLPLLKLSVAQAPTEKALLWEISGNGLQAPSYLFGTFHLLCKDELKMTSTIKDKVKNSKQLFLEFDINDPELPLKMMKSLQMEGDSSFHNFYDSTTYRMVDETLQRYSNLNLSMVDGMKPMGLYSIFMIGILDCETASWEQQLGELATSYQIPLKGLETVEQQAEIFDAIPYQVQADYLKEITSNMDSTTRALREMIHRYQTEDLPALYEKVMEDPSQTQHLDVLLFNRNRAWIPKIVEEAHNSASFFAFGAGHLGGDQGVINLLRKAGYTVKPLSNQ